MSENSESTYFYDPSLAASILFAVLYAFPAAFLLYTTVIGPRTGKYRYAKFFILACICAWIEVAGYVIRCLSIENPTSVPFYAVSSALLVIAPLFICASLYMLIGRLIRAGIPTRGKQQRILGISPKWLPRGFVTSDVLSLLTQAGGSGIAASNNWEGNEKDIGTNVLIGGLVLQLVTFSLFLIIIRKFHLRANEIRRDISNGVRQVLIGLYIAGFFIEVSKSTPPTQQEQPLTQRHGQVRCIYRLIEFALGIDGYPFRTEWLLYVLEACPMLLALCALGYYHPGKWLPDETLSVEPKGARSRRDLESR